MISIITLFFVFSLIITRQIGSVKIQIWQAMLFGSLIVLLTKQISLKQALLSINWEVMIFLFSMFIIGSAFEESGFLSYVSYKIFKKAKNLNQLLLLIVITMGLTSALLMNDTIAIIGTPAVLHIARKHRINPKSLLITLAFSITIGSVFSPIGNPQNFLIAIQKIIKNSFLIFFKYLFLATLINLFFCVFIIKIFYSEDFNNNSFLNHSEEEIKDYQLALLSKFSLGLLIFLIIIKILLSIKNPCFELKLVYITGIACLPILLFTRKRLNIIKKVDWHTLIFFASMFILMQSVWNSGFFQIILNNLKINILSINSIITISILLSQLISNVPLVALYLPLLNQAGASTKEMMALACGSTIAGNLFILGAASNVIIIQNAEKKCGETLTFLEFARIGIPTTIINALIYIAFF